MSNTLSNWFGLNKGSYIGTSPAYVDTTKLPGMTDIPKPTLIDWISRAPHILITSPNFVWALISLFMYFNYPYDLSPESYAALGPITYNFMTDRLPLWLSVTLGYFSFWHCALYFLNLAKRPYISERPYNIDKVAHNIFWTSSGIVIWTAVENVFCYLWATGRLDYVNNSDSFGTYRGMAGFITAMMAIPLWRSFHFYFAHRFLHFTPLYQMVHSLHHRNTDIEPFSGLCMHPVEHLYYFSCVLPSLVFTCSPYAFLWNGVHLLLSPAASHSGYEDHFQSDAFHYMHHRYFECNYAGTDAAFMDIWFGTFRGSLAENPVDANGPKPRDDAKSTLRTVPTKEFVTYLSLSAMSLGPWLYYSTVKQIISLKLAYLVCLLAGFGPVFLSVLISSVFKSKGAVEKVSMSTFGNTLHLTMGTVFCSLPVAYTCWLSLNK
jgi:sterol desaturase/sphingolipid hydroxylase (fatty acid hydroxylase superfamily)